MRTSRVLSACLALGWVSIGGESHTPLQTHSLSGSTNVCNEQGSMTVLPKKMGHQDFATIQMLQADHELPMVIESVQGTFDHKAKCVWLPNRTTLWQGRGQLSAQQCWYDIAKQQLRAKGDVVLCHEDGTIVLCQSIKASLKEKKGTASGVHVVSPQQWRMSAQKMTHTADQTQWTWGSFTPCTVCKVTDFPLWSLHAKQMTWKKSQKRLYCQKADLRVFGRSVATLPSISLATARSSGWLIPRIGQAQPLGWYVGAPYFINFSPEHDLTLTPFATTKVGGIVSGHYRAHTRVHRTNVQGAYNGCPPQDDGLAQTTPPDTLSAPNGALSVHDGPWHRPNTSSSGDVWSSGGFFHGDSVYRLNDTTRLLVDQWWISDDAFLASRPLFGHTQDAFLPSWVQIQHLTPQSYGFARTLRYRSLQPVWQKTSSNSWVASEFSYTWTPSLLKDDQRLSARVHAIGDAKWNNQRMKRVASDIQWGHIMAGPCGQLHEIQARMIGAAYAVNHEGGTANEWMAKDIAFDSLDHSPKALTSMVTWTSRFPWLMGFGSVITPVIQVVGSPSVIGTQTPPPNMDSQCLWFDETNVFQDQRFGGYDRLDDHSRLNAGVEWTCSATPHIDMHAVIAQSYAWQKPNPALLPVGVRQGLSDLIAAIGLQHDGLDGLYRMRWDPVSHRVTMQEMAWSAGPDYAKFTGSYIFQHHESQNLLQNHDDTRMAVMNVNQCTLQMTSALSDSWSASLFGTYDLGGGGEINTNTEPTSWRDMGVEIAYVNECLAVNVTIQKSYYSFQDIQPGWTVSLSFQLKAISSQSPSNRRFDHRIFSQSSDRSVAG